MVVKKWNKYRHLCGKFMLEGVMECDVFFFFFFNDTATTEIYTLSLHDALPISFTPIGDSRLTSVSSSILSITTCLYTVP